MRFRAEGECNQCGLCCIDKGSRCEHLEIVTIPGQPQATRCRIHVARQPGMTIAMVDMASGEPVGWGTCRHECSDEADMIQVRGQGNGCSLTFIEQYPPTTQQGGKVWRVSTGS